MNRRDFVVLGSGIAAALGLRRGPAAPFGIAAPNGVGCVDFRDGFEGGARAGSGSAIGANATFADRTRTVSAQASGSGDGSDADPWTLMQALQAAQAGMIIGVRAGLYIGQNQADSPGAHRYTPAFRTAGSGTAEAPIVLVAEHPAVHVASERSELRSGGTDVGGGWPAFGNYQRDHVWWIGFFSDEAAPDNKPSNDSAPAVLWSCEGGGIRLCDIRGVDVDFTDNHSGVRCEAAAGFEVSDCRIEGFVSGGGSSVNQAGVMTYRCVDGLFLHNEIRRCGNGLFWKALSPQTGLQARLNVFDDCIDVMRIGMLEGDLPSVVAQNLFLRYRNSAIFFTQLAAGGDVPQALHVCNNLFLQRGNSGGNIGPFRYDKVPYVADNRVYNNIVLDTNGGPVISSDFNREVDDITGYVDHQYNCYADHGPFGGSEGGSGSLRELTVAQWRDVHGMDLQGVFADPQLLDVGVGDYRLSASSPCLGAGRDILFLLGGAADAPINIGPHVNDCQSERFGVRGAD